MSGIFTFAAVDCDDQVSKVLCQEFEIQGFPTIKFMKPIHGNVEAQGTIFGHFSSNVDLGGRLLWS